MPSPSVPALLASFVGRAWRQWIRPLAVPLLFITAAKSALADINYVPTGSMQPAILPGDVLWVNKLAYDLRVPFTLRRLARWADPQRGDIVICFSPVDGTRLVKRVAGTPGDRIGGMRVPPGSYFLLGDNRGHSLDSRVFGPVPRRDIVGRATAVVVSADPDRWLRPRFTRWFTALE